MRVLSKDPANRPQTAEAMVDGARARPGERAFHHERDPRVGHELGRGEAGDPRSLPRQRDAQRGEATGPSFALAGAGNPRHGRGRRDRRRRPGRARPERRSRGDPPGDDCSPTRSRWARRSRRRSAPRSLRRLRPRRHPELHAPRLDGSAHGRSWGRSPPRFLLSSSRPEPTSTAGVPGPGSLYFRRLRLFGVMRRSTAHAHVHRVPLTHISVETTLKCRAQLLGKTRR